MEISPRPPKSNLNSNSEFRFERIERISARWKANGETNPSIPLPLSSASIVRLLICSLLLWNKCQRDADASRPVQRRLAPRRRARTPPGARYEPVPADLDDSATVSIATKRGTKFVEMSNFEIAGHLAPVSKPTARRRHCHCHSHCHCHRHWL